MSENYLFKISEATAMIDHDGLTVMLYYPGNPEPIYHSLPENLEFGIKVLEHIIKNGHSIIAKKESPIRPAASGCVFLFNDGKFLAHRRDKEAPTHPLYHSVPAG